MFYIVDEHGEFLGKFENRDDAIATREALIEEDPLAADETAIIELDSRGRRVGEPITATAVPA